MVNFQQTFLYVKEARKPLFVGAYAFPAHACLAIPPGVEGWQGC